MKSSHIFFAIVLCISCTVSLAQGVFEINAACADTGCFLGDNPATDTIEITGESGTYRLTSDLVYDTNNQPAILVDPSQVQGIVTIDLNGYTIEFNGLPSAGDNAIEIVDNNTIVTIKNGSITRFNDGIVATGGSTVVIENMVFRIMNDDAILASSGIIRNNVFDSNGFGIFSPNPGASILGDRLYIESNLFLDDAASQDPVASLSNTNYCKDNVIGYGGGSSNFDACTLAGTNLCDNAVCTTNRTADGNSVDEK